MAGGVRIESDPAGDMGEASGARVEELVRLMRRSQEPTPPPVAPAPMPSLWQRTQATMADLLRRASTPAPWERRATSALARLLRGGG